MTTSRTSGGCAILLIAALTISCTRGITPLERQVYATVLAGYVALAPDSLMVSSIADTIPGGTRIELVAPELRTAFGEAQRSAETLAQKTLAANALDPLPVRIVSQADAGEGRHVLHLSRIGFNSDSTRAVVYVEDRCSALCGEAHLHLLGRLPNGRWEQVQDVLLWVS